MSKKLDIAGNRFGYLTAIEYSHSENRRSIWKFQCELCNRPHLAMASDVKRGKIKSCGCAKNKGDKNGKWSGYKNLAGRVFGHYKYSAKLRGINFEISIEDMWEQYQKQDRICPYTKIELALDSKERVPNNASLDRKNSKLGYTKDNIQWVYKPINNMKNDMSHNEFVELCRLITESQ